MKLSDYVLLIGFAGIAFEHWSGGCFTILIATGLSAAEAVGHYWSANK